MFRPRRTSSPSRTATTSSHTSAPGKSFTATTPELASLAPDEIDFIDQVIAQAGPNASTFLSVLNAYNDVLRARGLDSRDEVVYYGKLLKLGTLKGRTWAEKWAHVRGAQAAVAGPSKPALQTTNVSSRLDRPLHRRDPDTFTLHSHDDNEDEDDSQTSTPRIARRPLSPASELSNSLGLSTAPLDNGLVRFPTYSRPPPAPPSRRPQLWESISVTSDSEEHTGSPTAAISAYQPGYRQNPPIIPRQRLTSDPKPPSANTSTVVAPTASRQAVEKARQGRSHNINDEDAWAKIKQARDEEDADVFRREQLLTRCWAVWREGLVWVATTHAQIAQARETLVLRRSVQKWRERAYARHDLSERVATLADARLLRRVVSVWTTKLAEHRQVRWRSDMRARMKAVRERHEHMLLADIWTRWKLAARAQGAERIHDVHVLEWAVMKWKGKMSQVRAMEYTADAYDERGDGRIVVRSWDRWRWMSNLRRREMVMAQEVNRRVLRDWWASWKKRMRQYQLASDFYDHVCLKNGLRSWKTSCDRIRKLERKADKHLARQDGVLIHAIVRVWRAHERGKLLERVRDSRSLQKFWSLWKQRMAEYRRQGELALAFAGRPRAALAASALQTWKHVHQARQRALQLASQYYAVQMQQRAVLAWRIRLRRHTKLAKQARIADKYFVVRGAWVRWRQLIDEKGRQRKLRQFEQARTKKAFDKWLERTQKERQLSLAEDTVKIAVATRVVRNALMKWTNRVIDYKLRELNVVQRNETILLTSTFLKWRSICARHAESLSLLESYMDVKREETARRVFYKWLNAARNKRHIRTILVDKEQEIKQSQLVAVWDKWRDRFKAERLRPIERDVLFQTQHNLLFRSFGIWLSKTNTLPAIRFEALHIKAKAWKKWRDAMPQALQAKAARDMYARNATTKFLKLWLERHRKKVALKAVARARYLRLPTISSRDNQPSRPLAFATSRPVTLVTRPSTSSATHPTTSSAARSHVARRLRETTPDPAASLASSVISEAVPDGISAFSMRPAVSSASRTAGTTAGLISILSARTSRPNASPPSSRPRLFPTSASVRDPSPARSRSSFGPRTITAEDVGGDGQDSSPTRVPPTLSSGSGPGAEGRSRLWHELQALQRKSRSPEGKLRR